MGYDSNNKILYLLNVEGREEKARGMTFSEVADMLLYFGCTDGISFDGGGSTAMSVRNPDGSYKHVNSQSYYRPVINAVGITAEKQKRKTRIRFGNHLCRQYKTFRKHPGLYVCLR